MSDLNSMMFTVDDPGLTAFALGELECPESERYAAAVAQSLELQELVRQIQFEAQLLTTELQREPAVPMNESHKAAIFNQLRDRSSLTPSTETMSTESTSTEATRHLVSHQTGDMASHKSGVHKAGPKRWVSWLAVASSTVAVAAVVAVCLPRPRPSETALMGKSAAQADLANAALPVATPATDSADGLSSSPASPAMSAASTSAPYGERSLKSASDSRELADTSHVVSEPVQASVSTLDFSPADESGPVGNSVTSKPSSDAVRSKSGQRSSSEQMGEGEHLEGAKGLSIAGRTSSVRRALTPRSEVNTTQLSSSPGGAPSQESDQLSGLTTARPLSTKPATKTGTKPGSNPESMRQSKEWAESGDQAESGSQGRFDVSKRPSAGKSGQVASLESREKKKDGYSSGDDVQYISPGSSEGKPRVTLEQLEASRPGQGQPQGGPGKPGMKGADAFGRETAQKGDLPGVLDAYNQLEAKEPAASAPESNTPFGTTVDSLADRPTAKPDAAAAGIESKFSRGSEKTNLSFSKGDTKGDAKDNEVTKSEQPLDGAKRSKQFALAELSKLTEAEGRESRGLSGKDLQDLERSTKELGRNQPVPRDPVGAETYQPIFENSFIPAAKERVSTFSIDVDSASYSNARRFLESGQVPHPDAIRIEELVNYFAYQYPVPQDGKPFSVNTDIAGCPWNPGHHLVRIGLKGREIPKGERPPSNLVFLVDVSGSMSPENKLPLVRSSLKTLVSQLDERDRIAIVTYAGEAGVKLPATSVAQKDVILAAIDSLGAGGSTNGAAGINTAYDIAAKEFLEKGTNRVILCTDGDFNVGVTSDDALVQMIQTRAKGGVFLSIFGFGMGNLKDAKLEQLADKGNGQYGYIDDRLEADKVFVQELSGTLVTIAKDVKIQIDFNPETVGAYRLIGYENRTLAAEDFNNDKKDAGEIGAGHTVTALYEIVPTKELKADEKTPWMTVKLRYKQPEATSSELIENPLLGMPGQLKLAHTDFQFAAAVASFGMLLRNSQHAGQANWSMVKELAQSGLSHDPYGHRSGFLGLVNRAESLLGERRPAAPPEPDSTVNGKYKSLLRRLNVPQDEQSVGRFRDYGFDQTKAYGGAENLPEGYWVYAAPYWYIWGETTQATPK